MAKRIVYRSKNSSSHEFSGIGKWFLVAAVALALPITVYMTGQQQNTRQEASTSYTPIDTQTGEYYDLAIESTVVNEQQNSGGPAFLAVTTFRIGGTRANNTQELSGFLQRSTAPYGNESIEFTYNPNEFHKFVSKPVKLVDNNCIDLYTSKTKVSDKYFATFCFKNTYLSPEDERRRVYSYSANPFLELDYKGSKTTVVQFLTTAFDKRLNPTNNKDGGNFQGHRVNYLTLDTNSSSLSDFQNVTYFFQPLTRGLSDGEATAWCSEEEGTLIPPKLIRQTYGPQPEGGNSYNLVIKSYCSFQYTNSSSLIPFYLSMYKDRVLTQSPTPASGNVPSLTPTTVQEAGPVIGFKSPVNGSTLPKYTSIKVEVGATHASGVGNISIFVNNESAPIKTCTNTTSCIYWWDPKPGTYTLKARATSKANTSNVSTITVTRP